MRERGRERERRWRRTARKGDRFRRGARTRARECAPATARAGIASRRGSRSGMFVPRASNRPRFNDSSTDRLCSPPIRHHRGRSRSSMAGIEPGE